MTSSQKTHLIGFLVTELKGNENVKTFSNNLRYLNLCDLQKDEHLDKVTENGGALLQTLVSWNQLGFIDKLVEIKKGINDE